MEPDTGSVHSTLRRKGKPNTLGLGEHVHGHGHGGGSTSSHRQSLAFELAAAMEPVEGDQASILDRLGLDDEEEAGLYEEDEYEYGDSDEEGEESQAGLTTAASLGRPSYATLDARSPARASVRELGATPTRLVRRASRSTINTLEYNSPHGPYAMLADDLAESGLDCDDEEAEDSLYERRLDDERSETHSEDGQVLEAGLEATAKFLRMLKQANADCALPPAPTASAPAAEDTQQHQPDRQPVIEKLVAELVRTMAEQVRDREGQIRELREMESALARTDRRVLAELDALPPPSEDGQHERADGCATPHAASAESGEPKRTGTPLEDLGALKLETTSLIDSLNQIHEHTQVNRQTQTEVVRKLKGVRALVTNWKSEHESVESSKEVVGAWEKEHGVSGEEAVLNGDGVGVVGKRVRGLFEVEIKLAVSETEKLLDDAFVLASKLLVL